MDKDLAPGDENSPDAVEFDIKIVDLDDIEGSMCSCKASDDNPYQGTA